MSDNDTKKLQDLYKTINEAVEAPAKPIIKPGAPPIPQQPPAPSKPLTPFRPQPGPRRETKPKAQDADASLKTVAIKWLELLGSYFKH